MLSSSSFAVVMLGVQKRRFWCGGFSLGLGMICQIANCSVGVFHSGIPMTAIICVRSDSGRVSDSVLALAFGLPMIGMLRAGLAGLAELGVLMRIVPSGK